MSDLTIAQSTIGAVTVVAPAGRVDSTTAKNFEVEVTSAIDGGASKIVLDLQGVNYISSAGLRVVLIAGKHLKAAGGKLALAGMQPAIRDVFEISGFLGLFEVRDTAQEAAEAL